MNIKDKVAQAARCINTALEIKDQYEVAIGTSDLLVARTALRGGAPYQRISAVSFLMEAFRLTNASNAVRPDDIPHIRIMRLQIKQAINSLVV